MSNNGTHTTVKMETTEAIVSAAKHQFGGVHFKDTDFYLKGLLPSLYTAGISDMSVDPIKSIEHFRIRPRWLFVRVETEKGIVGWGEATLEGEDARPPYFRHHILTRIAQAILRLLRALLSTSASDLLAGTQVM